MNRFMKEIFKQMKEKRTAKQLMEQEITRRCEAASDWYYNVLQLIHEMIIQRSDKAHLFSDGYECEECNLDYVKRAIKRNKKASIEKYERNFKHSINVLYPEYCDSFNLPEIKIKFQDLSNRFKGF